jgi:hypothetical protein
MQWETIRKIFRSSHGQRRRSAPQALCGTQIGVAKASAARSRHPVRRDVLIGTPYIACHCGV